MPQAAGWTLVWALAAVMWAGPSVGSRPGLQTVLADWAHVVSAPTRLDGDGAWRLAVLGGVTLGAVFFFDEPLNEHFALDGNNTPLGLPSLVSDTGRTSELYGSIRSDLFSAGTAGGLLLAGWWLKDDKALGTGALMAEAALFTKAVVVVGKFTFGRARPFLGEGARRFDGFSLGHRRPRRSFPSGHTSAAFALATVAAKRYPRPWVRWPAYGLAAAVAFQRVESNNHWVSDTLVGGAIGYGVAAALTRRYRGGRPTSQALVPWLVPGRLGAMWQVRFG